MKKLVMVLLCLMISAPVYANNWKNYITAPNKVVDPTTIFSNKTDFFQHMAWWNATEIPRTMTTYMDTDKNGSIDEGWGFNILKEFNDFVLNPGNVILLFLTTSSVDNKKLANTLDNSLGF